MSYRDDARSDAKETVAYFKDEIVGMLLEKGEASDDLFNDYPNGDSYHHENHTDKSYDLQEAAGLLDELSDNEETDSGLWQGLEPREAVCAQAAYTYGNAVYAEWRELIEKINDEANDLGVTIPAYTVADLKLAHEADDWKLSLSANNIFDRKYYTYGVKSAFTPGRYNAYPLPERSIIATAEYAFK